MSWRDLLKVIINDTHEKQRIASELGLNPVTLVRWTTQDIDPRPQNLRRHPMWFLSIGANCLN